MVWRLLSMGIYLNPDNENFKATLTRKIYVDKTMMIAVINEFMATDNKYLCVSRPCRCILKVYAAYRREL